MKTAIIFDCEFLVTDSARGRFWCGPYDPDPIVAQIGAVKLGLEDDFPILDTFMAYVKPIDRNGSAYDIAPFFTDLTGITASILREKGTSIQTALNDVNRFSDDAKFWSWGKDELNMLAISCYVAGISPPIPARRFDNACKLLLAAGMPYETLQKIRSNALPGYFGISIPQQKAHDALSDALSIASVLQHLLITGKLKAQHFEPDGTA